MRLIDADILKRKFRNVNEGMFQLSRVYELIDNSPIVYPICEDKACKYRANESPKGEWIEDSGNIACSHCHTIWLYRRTDFCPNCGADMRGKK